MQGSVFAGCNPPHLCSWRNSHCVARVLLRPVHCPVRPRPQRRCGCARTLQAFADRHPQSATLSSPPVRNQGCSSTLRAAAYAPAPTRPSSSFPSLPSATVRSMPAPIAAMTASPTPGADPLECRPPPAPTPCWSPKQVDPPPTSCAAISFRPAINACAAADCPAASPYSTPHRWRQNRSPICQQALDCRQTPSTPSHSQAFAHLISPRLSSPSRPRRPGFALLPVSDAARASSPLVRQ